LWVICHFRYRNGHGPGTGGKTTEGSGLTLDVWEARGSMNTRKLILMTVFTAIAVAGSVFVSFPAGIARAYPIQHAVNVIAAILLGPVPAVIIAFMTGLVRILTG